MRRRARPICRELAAANRVWLVVGLGVDNGRERRNEAWWFAPDGVLKTNYLKHFMAPPEREFVAGGEFPVNAIDGVNYGVAICKDMHFASLGRGSARATRRDVRAGLGFSRRRVDGGEHDEDAWHREWIRRGAFVARRLLSVSDAYGRMLAVARSTDLPGTSLFATVKVGTRVPTIYTRIGDTLGWLCVAGAIALVVAAWRRTRRRASPPSEV